MKRIGLLSVLIGLVLTITSCGGNSELKVEDNDWSAEGLRGKVKSITQRNYQAQNQLGGWVKGPSGQTYFVKQFSEKGINQAETTYFINDNSMYGGSIYQHDTESNLQKINRTGADGSNVGYTEILERKGKVRPVKFNNYFTSPDESVLTGSSEMVWEGARIKENKFYDKDGKLISESSTMYDDNGHIAEFKRTDFTQNAAMVMRYTYLTYDDEGNWTSALKEVLGYNVKEIIERQYQYYQ